MHYYLDGTFQNTIHISMLTILSAYPRVYSNISVSDIIHERNKTHVA